MTKVLVIYGTRERQTEKIARAIADEIRKSGCDVELADARSASKQINLKDYQTVIAGGPVHKGEFPKELRDWVKSHASELKGKSTAFFSVCLGILQKDDPKVIAEEKQIVEDFFAKVDWRPSKWTIFAGALKYSQYGFFKRQMLRLIAGRAGGSTDTSRDYEYTDWNEVRSFARETAPGLG